jgi:hypothetical protein
MSENQIPSRLISALRDCWEPEDSSDDVKGLLWKYVSDLDKYPQDDKRCVERVLREVDGDVGRQLVSDLVDLLNERGLFDSEADIATGRADRLRAAVDAADGTMRPSGEIVWAKPGQAKGGPAGTGVVPPAVKAPSIIQIRRIHKPTTSADFIGAELSTRSKASNQEGDGGTERSSAASSPAVMSYPPGAP